MSHHLTLHIIASVPYSNLNRDDTGTPKHVRRGGYLAALLSWEVGGSCGGSGSCY